MNINNKRNLLSLSQLENEAGVDWAKVKRQRRPLKLPKTDIEVIEDYYDSLNQSSEVEKVSYMNEYRRLFESCTKIWSLAKNKIPLQEQYFVTSILERETQQSQ